MSDEQVIAVIYARALSASPVLHRADPLTFLQKPRSLDRGFINGLEESSTIQENVSASVRTSRTGLEVGIPISHSSHRLGVAGGAAADVSKSWGEDFPHTVGQALHDYLPLDA